MKAYRITCIVLFSCIASVFSADTGIKNQTSNATERQERRVPPSMMGITISSRYSEVIEKLGKPTKEVDEVDQDGITRLRRASYRGVEFELSNDGYWSVSSMRITGEQEVSPGIKNGMKCEAAVNLMRSPGVSHQENGQEFLTWGFEPPDQDYQYGASLKIKCDKGKVSDIRLLTEWP